jgi:NAD-dependent dihydropyrimidine dehydrogenase PreA subunit
VQEIVRVLLRFDKTNVDRPITSQIILDLGTPINILSAKMNQLGGEILVDIPLKQADKIIKAFREKGVTVDTSILIEKDDDKCIDCGACVSLCPVDALYFDNDFSVVLEPDKCNGSSCGLCVDSCVRAAIQLKE